MLDTTGLIIVLIGLGVLIWSSWEYHGVVLTKPRTRVRLHQFLPLGDLTFFMDYWDDLKKPIYRGLLGILCLALGMMLRKLT